MGGKGKGGAGFAAGAPPVGNQESVLGFREEQRENAEAFRERHADDGLDEDLAGRAGIATDGFSGFLADETDAEGGAEKTESATDIAGDFSDDGHVVDLVVVAVAAVRTRSTLPAIN
jgi:hypothetical protein